jgi:hypothetical protein
MKTLNEIIAELKAENPTLRSGNEEDGYTDLSSAEYEATIQEWANNILDLANKEAEAQVAKDAALAKLTALGLTADDLVALGL